MKKWFLNMVIVIMIVTANIFFTIAATMFTFSVLEEDLAIEMSVQFEKEFKERKEILEYNNGIVDQDDVDQRDYNKDYFI